MRAFGRRLRGATGVRAIAAIAFVVGVAGVPTAATASVRGVWEGPVGRVRISGSSGHLVGVLVADSPDCPFKKGTKVLEGQMLLGNLSGKLRFCAVSCAKAGSRWAFAMLVASGGRLSGAAHVTAPGCKVPGRTAKGGVVFRRAHRHRRHRGHAGAKAGHAGAKGGSAPLVLVPPGTGSGGDHAADAKTGTDAMDGPSPAAGTYDPRNAGSPRAKAMDVARDGMTLLNAGRFEQARKRFETAVKIDPGYAEGYNGIGVTYAMRRDWKEAASWYQRSIAANPDIGDAYYNLACAYAQTKKPTLAVRYLRLAVLNGYSQVDQIRKDDDLAPLRGRSDYRAVLALGSVGH